MDYEIMMNGSVRIGQRAPEFEATTTMGSIALNDYRGKCVVLFSHPGDFTPVKSYNLGKVEIELPFGVVEPTFEIKSTCTSTPH